MSGEVIKKRKREIKKYRKKQVKTGELVTVKRYKSINYEYGQYKLNVDFIDMIERELGYKDIGYDDYLILLNYTRKLELRKVYHIETKYIYSFMIEDLATSGEIRKRDLPILIYYKPYSAINLDVDVHFLKDISRIFRLAHRQLFDFVVIDDYNIFSIKNLLYNLRDADQHLIGSLMEEHISLKYQIQRLRDYFY